MRYNIVKLNEHISGNVEAVEIILENLGCENLTYHQGRREFRCSRDAGKNPSAVKVNVDTLGFTCYSTGERGSIYNFIMIKKDCNFPTALRWVQKLLKLDSENLIDKDIKLPFCGFYKQINQDIKEPELSVKTYPVDVLAPYLGRYTKSFVEDGIDVLTQQKFMLGYDFETDRIIIPQWNMNGELVGLMGRSNDKNIPYEFRWLPIIPCSRSYTLFGYHQNYAKIQQQQLCVVTESEKGVMQLASMGKNYGLATCTKSISAVQERYLKALRVEKIVLAYDQGLSQEELEHEAAKLKLMNPIYKNKVGYIYDPKGDILALGSKDSPTDLGSKAFETLLNKYTIWI